MPSQLKQTWRTPRQMDFIVFLIYSDVEVRCELQMEIPQSDPCTFSVNKTPPESPTARHRGPNKGGNVHLIDVRLKARVLFPETNNQAA